MRAALLAFALALAACSGGNGGGSGTASPPPPPPPPPQPPAVVVERAVSGLSPFAPGCGGTGGTAFVNAEVEPYLAVDPRDANHLVAVWQQDRWSNGAARGLAGALSLDGGTTWTPAQVPWSECTGNPAFARATDPWVSFGPDGTAWQSALVTVSPADSAANAMLASRSPDGGRTWAAPATLIRDTGVFFNDKESLTADPLDARFAYVVWDRLERNVNGPTWFARTTDGGATWEAARAIHDPGPRSQTIGNLVRVLPDGTLVNLFTQLDPGVGDAMTGSLRVIRSTDRGATWSAPVVVSSHQPLGTRDPATQRVIRDGSVLAQMAAGPGGALHVVWQDGRFTGARDAIAYSRSADGGLTWSAPTRVNADPSVPAFMPQVHVGADGTIGITYYDLRSDTPAPETLPTDYWIARSSDGAAWSETRVAGPFDLMTAPATTGGLFLGDYMGLASSGTTFLALYVRTTGDPANATDVFLARIPPSAPGTEGDAQAKRLVERGADFRARVAENFARALAARGRPPP